MIKFDYIMNLTNIFVEIRVLSSEKWYSGYRQNLIGITKEDLLILSNKGLNSKYIYRGKKINANIEYVIVNVPWDNEIYNIPVGRHIIIQLTKSKLSYKLMSIGTKVIYKNLTFPECKIEEEIYTIVKSYMDENGRFTYNLKINL